VTVTVPEVRTRPGASRVPGRKHASKRSGFCRHRRDTSAQVSAPNPAGHVGGSRFLTVDPVDGGCANPYTYGFGDPLNHPDLSGQEELFDGGGGGACPTHHKSGSFWGDVATIAGYVGAAVGFVAAAVGSPAWGIVGAVIGAVGFVIDGKSCLSHVFGSCVAAALGALGVVGGIAGAFKLGSRALITRAVGYGLLSSFAAAELDESSNLQYIPPSPC
jgi:hypothetical protein